MVKVEDFKSSWAEHFDKQKEYFNPPNKPRTVNVPLKLLSREEAPRSDDKTIRGHHIDDLTGPRDGVWSLDDYEVTSVNGSMPNIHTIRRIRGGFDQLSHFRFSFFESVSTRAGQHPQ